MLLQSLMLVLVSPALAQEQAIVQKISMESPNAPLVADLVHSTRPELVLTDVRGRLKVFDALTLKLMDSITIGDAALTAAVVGDFNGDNAPDLALASFNGDVLVLSGQTLRLLGSINIGSSCSVQPTVLPDFQPGGRDTLFLPDRNGTIHAFRMNEAGVLVKLWSYSSGTTIQAPLTVGHVRSLDHWDVVGTTGDGNVVIVDSENSPERPPDKLWIQQNAPISNSALLVDLDGDEHDEIVTVLDRGEVRARVYSRERRTIDDLWKVGPRNTNAPAVGPPTLLRTSRNMYILQLSESNIHVFDAKSGAEVISAKDQSFSGASTPPALIPRSDAVPEMAFGLKQTFQVTNNLQDWIDQRETTVTLLTANSAELNHRPTTSLATAIDPDNSAVYVIGVSPEKEGMLYAYRTQCVVSVPGLWPTRTTWMTHGGSPMQNPDLNREYMNLTRRRDEALRAQIANWSADLETAIADSRWDEATDLAANLADLDPYNLDYQKKRRQVAVKRHLVSIIVGVSAFLALLGYTSFKTVQFLGRRRLRVRAESAVARREFDEARRFYTRLLAKAPRNAKVATALARVFIAQRDYSAESLPVYAQAYAANPTDQDIQHSYARALLLEPQTTKEAAGVYEAALQTFPEPHYLEYGLGRCALATGNYEEAGKRLRSALRGGITSDALYRALTEVYIRQKNFTAKALPVFEQQFPSRMEDREFLEGYLLACIDGKKLDQKVESLCQTVLEMSPGFLPAYLQLAQIMLQKNQVGTAIDEVRTALNLDPHNSHAIQLLANCHLIQNRKDEEAMQSYRAALAVAPADKELLRMMTTVFYERGMFTPEAIDIYRRTLDQLPSDVTALRALAQTAHLTNDFDLSIRSIEALVQQGQSNPRFISQLAQAYVHKHVQDEKAERILREALRAEPGNIEFISALAGVFCAQNRVEVETIPVLENHLQRHPGDIRAGRQLARAYINSNRYEKALATTKGFLILAPDDEDLQRLNAQASLFDNKIDEAVSEYRRLLDRNPNDRDALVNLALAYGQKMRTDGEAVDCYNRALNIQPKNDMLHLAMGRVFIERNDAVKAVEKYREALAARANNEQNVIAHLQAVLTERPEVLRLRWFLIELLVAYGHFRESLDQIEFICTNHPGQNTNILRALETILAKDANNVTALIQQGSMLMATGQPEQAAQSLEKALKLRPTDPAIQEKLVLVYRSSLEKKESPDVRFKLGQVYYGQQEYDHAIGSFQQTAQDYRWEAESTKMLGKCFTGKGMLDLALQEFKKLVVDAETKELLYDLAQRYEGKKDLVGAKTVYRQLFAADINYKDVKQRFEMLSGSTSDPMAFEKTSIVQQMSEEAARRYELLDELGRGAMGIVYRARDKELDEIVALKILPDNMSNNPEAVRRFKIEARNARKLSHPNIVRIHDIGEEMGRKYISMEYVDGNDLKKYMKSAPEFRLPVPEVIRFCMQCADALGYAHRLGIVHRDIKPANIMLTGNNDVKVTDFGIAKLLDADGAGEGTMVGAVIGTPLYMSPEQVQGIPVDNRADIYSFGVMFYELLNGRPPFTEGDLAYQHIHREPNVIQGLEPKLWEIVAKCLAKKKEDRWDKAEIIYDELRAYAKANGMPL